MTAQKAPSKRKKPQQFIIMIAGNTHAGKTTFARRLLTWLPNTELIEADPIAAFLYHTHPDLQLRKNVIKYGWRKPVLKFKIYFTILQTALGCGKNVILTNHIVQLKWRRKILRVVKKFNVRTLLVFIDLPDWLLSKRIKQTRRTKETLFKCQNYQELLLRHIHKRNPPTTKEVDHLFMVSRVSELPIIERKIRRLVKSFGYAG
jgi:predicted kinase